MDIFTYIDIALELIGIYLAYILFYKEDYTDLSNKFRNLANKLSTFTYYQFISYIGDGLLYIGRLINGFDDVLNLGYKTISDGTLYLSANIRKIQNGNAELYIDIMLIGMLILLILLVVGI